jgi:hypothetical protein
MSIPDVPFGGTREQKSMPPRIVDTGRDVYPSGSGEKCRYRVVS